MLLLILTYFTCYAHCQAGLLILNAALNEPSEHKEANIVQKPPRAVSYQRFTRVQNQATQVQQPNLRILNSNGPTRNFENAFQTTAVGAERLQTPHTASPSNSGGSNPSVVQTLTRTPAQFTYAAAPVVFQTLPQMKPVRKISYDELLPGPRYLSCE